MEQNSTNPVVARLATDGTGPQWEMPATEAARILRDRVAAGIDTWADAMLAATFQTLAKEDPEGLLSGIAWVRHVLDEWQGELEKRS